MATAHDRDHEWDRVDSLNSAWLDVANKQKEILERLKRLTSQDSIEDTLPSTFAPPPTTHDTSHEAITCPHTPTESVASRPATSPMPSLAELKMMSTRGHVGRGALQLRIPKGVAWRQTADIEDFFELEDELGQGGFSLVWRGRDRTSGHQRALKLIDAGAASRHSHVVETEVAVMAAVHHPRMVALQEVVFTDAHFVLVMELVDGGELFSLIAKNKVFTESVARDIFTQLLGALKAMHDCGIAHRDLKPENILLEGRHDRRASLTDHIPLKVSDFGLSIFVDPSHPVRELAGTIEYCAPEILKGEPYTFASDTWSLGVILYILLSGFPPFYGQNLKQQVERGVCTYSKDAWGHVSPSAVELVKGLLCADPRQRLTLSQAASHPWTCKHTPPYPSGGGDGDHLERRASRLAAKTEQRMSKQAPVRFTDRKESGIKEPAVKLKSRRQSIGGEELERPSEIPHHARPSWKMPKHTTYRTADKITELYDIQKELGRGGFSIVYQGVDRQSGLVVALKVIESKLFHEYQELMETEAMVLAGLKHPRLVSLHEVVRTKSEIIFVTEFVKGGELFEKIVELKSFTPVVAWKITSQVLDALETLHSNSIIHRDVKPENVLLEGENLEQLNIKLTDFGLSILYDESNLAVAAGTLEYSAPEVLNHKPYDYSCDVWSVGVMLYILLAGYPPFYGKTEAEVKAKIIKGSFSFGRPVWADIGADAQSLIKGMLTVDRSRRLTIPQIRQHKWMRLMEGQREGSALTGVSKQLIAFVATRKFRRAVFAALAVSKFHNYFRAASMSLQSQGSDMSGRVTHSETSGRVGVSSEHVRLRRQGSGIPGPRKLSRTVKQPTGVPEHSHSHEAHTGMAKADVTATRGDAIRGRAHTMDATGDVGQARVRRPSGQQRPARRSVHAIRRPTATGQWR